MRQSDRFVSSSIFVLLIVLLGWTPLGAQEQIDWEGLPAGTFLCGSAPPPAGPWCFPGERRRQPFGSPGGSAIDLGRVVFLDFRRQVLDADPEHGSAGHEDSLPVDRPAVGRLLECTVTPRSRLRRAAG